MFKNQCLCFLNVFIILDNYLNSIFLFQNLAQSEAKDLEMKLQKYVISPNKYSSLKFSENPTCAIFLKNPTCAIL